MARSKSKEPSRRSLRVSRRSAAKLPVEQSASTSRDKPRQRSRSRRGSISEETSVHDASVVPLVDVQKIQKKVVKGVIVDSFCWICHKSCDEILCDACPRAYHENCFNKDKAVCDCKQRNVNGRISKFLLSPVELKEMLQYAMQEAIKEEKKNANKTQKENSDFCKFFKTWPDVPENQLLLKIIDLDGLIDKLNDIPPYQSTAHFYSDVKWIYHNCCIMYGADNQKTQTALKLQKNFLRELTDIEACHDCYQHKHSAAYNQKEYTNSFTKVCRASHLIVWAKLRGSPFWPAKCLKIHNGHADVRFFGTHDKSVIAIKQIYQISKAHPEGKNINNMPKLREAMDELYLYVSNYEKRLGPFKFYEKQVPVHETPSKPKKKPHKKQTSSHAVIPEKESVSDPVETKVKAILHLPFASSEDTISRNSENSEPVENVSDSTSRVVCQMTFTADEESPDLAYDDLMTGSTIHDSPSENSSQKEISVNGTPLSHTISESHVLHSSSGFGNSATASRRKKGNCRNVSSSLPVITSAQSTREDITNNIPVSNTNCSAADSGVCSTSRLEQLCNLDKNALINQIFDAEKEVQLEDDSENEVQVLSEKTSRRLIDMFLKTPALDKTVAELVMSNRPSIRDLYNLFVNFSSRVFLSLIAEANPSNLGIDQLCNVQSFVLNFIAQIEFLRKGLRDTQKELKDTKNELEKERTKPKTPLDQNKITNHLMQATLNKYSEEKKKLEQKNQELEESNEQLKANVSELNIVINDFKLKEKEKDEQIAELLNEREQECQCRFKRNAGDDQENVPDSCIYNERNDAQMEELSVPIFKNQKESDINCDVNDDVCPASESHQSYFTHTDLETGRILVFQQSNMATVTNSSSFNGPVLCETSIVSGCSLAPSSMVPAPPTTLLQVPVMVPPSSMMQSPNPSYLSSDISCGIVIPNSSFQSNTSDSSYNRKPGSSSQPKTSGSKASLQKSSHGVKRQMTGVTSTKKRRKD